ncbi:MAG: hypothetical protein BAJALOKI1v1_1750005 [Promethearchaeota archaeon]|nr:MAG: hypothetical protein BAJALOKI1v1_1750005 [Candidatus Lokiarchaeota archaeon]
MNSSIPPLKPSKVIYKKFIAPAINYYQEILPKISSYFFCSDSLTKMIGFQQLIISTTYQIKRNDARSSKGVDYVKECVSQITKPQDLLNLMKNWDAFDLNLTAPSFVNPMLASNIRKKYCKIGNRYFDCLHCGRIACRRNLLWNESTIMVDIDTNPQYLDELYTQLKETLEVLNLEHSIKLSSLHGYHINIGLPQDAGKTLFDRSVFHYCLLQELLERGLKLDDNSLDPVPIIRAPFSLHYKRLTPSLPVNDDLLGDAIEVLREIESNPLEERISQATGVSKGWHADWFVKNSSIDSFVEIIEKWSEKAEKAILRERKSTHAKKTNVGDYLRKGLLMSKEDEKIAFQLLLKEGKSEDLAHTIIEINKKKEFREKRNQINKKETSSDFILKTQEDVPVKILHLPPPLIVLIIDNATLSDMKKITGLSPLGVKALCTNTDEGFHLLFRHSKLLKEYSKKWHCTSVYIGGLYSAYNFCSAADLVIAVKMKNVWDRDSKILKELETKLFEFNNDLIVAHLLGLDFCKDHSLNTEGALLVFKRFIKKIFNTQFSIILTTDHSGERNVPYFELITHQHQK